MNRTAFVSEFAIDETYLFRRINSEERLGRATKQPEVDYILARRNKYNSRRSFFRMPLVTDWTRKPEIDSAYMAKTFVISFREPKAVCYGPFKNFNHAKEFSQAFFGADWVRRVGESPRVSYGEGLNVYTFPDHQIASGWTFARLKIPELQSMWNPVPPPKV
jgi:hypothetical protein